MPKLLIPPIEARIARDDARGWSLYAKDPRDDAPLYRLVKIMTDTPWIDKRHTAHLAFIVHQARFSRGGDSWLLEQHAAGLKAWAEQQCSECFDAEYVKDTFGFSDVEYLELIAAEQGKYKK